MSDTKLYFLGRRESVRPVQPVEGRKVSSELSSVGRWNNSQAMLKGRTAKMMAAAAAHMSHRALP